MLYLDRTSGIILHLNSAGDSLVLRLHQLDNVAGVGRQLTVRAALHRPGQQVVHVQLFFGNGKDQVY